MTVIGQRTGATPMRRLVSASMRRCSGNGPLPQQYATKLGRTPSPIVPQALECDEHRCSQARLNSGQISPLTSKATAVCWWPVSV